MIDFHCHILPAIDDGANSVEEAISMAKSLSAFGYKAVCCTPHCIKGYYDLTSQQVREATLMLQADLDNEDVQLELWPGMEYMLDEYFSEYADDLLPLGETTLVLCEAPPQAHSGYVLEGLKLIVEKGFVPLIAHPERTQYFYEILSLQTAGSGSLEKSEKKSGPDSESPVTPLSFIKKLFATRGTRHTAESFDLEPFQSLPEDCLFLANLGSFSGYYGPQIQSRAYELLKHGRYTGVASDLHEGASANQVLQCDKLEFNPLLKELSGWGGFAPSSLVNIVVCNSGQRELF